MTQNKSKNETKSKDQKKNNVDMTVAESNVRNEIVEEAKKIALHKTSSAYDLIQKTRELLQIEDMQKKA